MSGKDWGLGTPTIKITGLDRMGQPVNPNLSEAPHALLSDKVVQLLAVLPETGLSQAEAVQRLMSDGPIRLRRQKPRSAMVILFRQFRSVIVWLLAAAAVIPLIMGDIAEGGAMIIVLLLNGAIGFVTELRVARSMTALFRMAEVRTCVRRDGRVQMIDAREVVPGDVVVLEGDDVVTADLRLHKASSLQAGTSILTGKAARVAKSPEPVAEDTILAERKSMVFKGTGITRGAGEAIVTTTGRATDLGRISQLAEAAKGEPSPLEARLERLGRTPIWLTLILAAGSALTAILHGQELAIMIRTAVALAVAAIPEGLPLVATLSLARGIWRMARCNARICRLSAVKTSGATTFILTDKTGTLTEIRMSVVPPCWRMANSSPMKAIRLWNARYEPVRPAQLRNWRKRTGRARVIQWNSRCLKSLTVLVWRFRKGGSSSTLLIRSGA